MEAARIDDALLQLCPAIDATAKAEFGISGRSSYKRFIGENFELITRLAFGGPAISNLFLGVEHPMLEPDADGCASVQDVLYHVVRCGIIHDAAIHDAVCFAPEDTIRVAEGRVQLPQSMVWGMILAVIVAPVNRDQTSQTPKSVTLAGVCTIPFDRLWGRRQELHWLLGVWKEHLESVAQSPPRPDQ